jgi:cytochrome c-type biogenesis protein CcmE
MYAVLGIVFGVGLAAALALVALTENMNHFHSPSDVRAGKAVVGREFRLGGVVQEGSVVRAPDSLEVEFLVTDRLHTVPMRYHGILPDLFREGQSVIGIGRLDESGRFVAHTVLAKHDETYMPPEVAEAIARGKAAKAAGAAATAAAEPAP